MTDETPSRDAELFLQLIMGLQQNGLIALGKMMNPITRSMEKNLEAARGTIDLLAALETRTRGNLESDEARVLQQVLSELRVSYVEEVSKAEAGKK